MLICHLRNESVHSDKIMETASTHVGTKEWYTVNPKGVEGVDAVSGLGTLTESTGNPLVTATTSTSVVV
jgi:hypothetical protein